jgi:hypothetical protein
MHPQRVALLLVIGATVLGGGVPWYELGNGVSFMYVEAVLARWEVIGLLLGRAVPVAVVLLPAAACAVFGRRAERLGRGAAVGTSLCAALVLGFVAFYVYGVYERDRSLLFNPFASRPGSSLRLTVAPYLVLLGTVGLLLLAHAPVRRKPSAP